MKVFSLRSTKLFLIVCVGIYCLKVIGLAPFHIPIGKPVRIKPYSSRVEVFSFSKFGLIYNILLLIPATVLSWFYGLTKMHTVNSDTSTMANFLSVLVNGGWITSILANCLILIAWAFRQKTAASVMNRLLEVDVRLSGMRKRPFNKRALISPAVHILLNACLWLVWPGLIISFSGPTDVIAEFIVRLPEFAIYWFFMEYVSVLGLVSRDLETVNRYLLDFKEFGNYLSRPPVRAGRLILAVSVSSHSNSQAASLKLLRGVRTMLYELCGDIADFFSLPILICITCYFIVIFQRVYDMTRMANVYTLTQSAGWMMLLFLKYIYPLVALTMSVGVTKNEAGLTGHIVHKLLAEARTEEIKAELEQYSLQLLHENVDFTAYGMFTLDSTLLHSMLAGVVSYIIILLQFGTPECNCKDTSAQ